MHSALHSFIREHDLSPFSKQKKSVKGGMNALFKTSDARAVYTKVLQYLSSEFQFADTASLWQYFYASDDPKEIERRQIFFSTISESIPREVLASIVPPRQTWKPAYSVIVITEDESIFLALKQLACPVQFIIGEDDIRGLESYDLVQVIGCEQFQGILERLPQSVFLRTLDDAYLERYLEQLSGWRETIERIVACNPPREIQEIIDPLLPLLPLLDQTTRATLTHTSAQETLEHMNASLGVELKQVTIAGDTLVTLLSRESLPKELQHVVNRVITSSGLPPHLLVPTIPLRFDERELENYLQRQSAQSNATFAAMLMKHARALCDIPNRMQLLSDALLFADFSQGVCMLLAPNAIPVKLSKQFHLRSAPNLFLKNPQLITFHLGTPHRCSMLTGANSGGKTTLLEHIVQVISLAQIGLPLVGEIETPLFSSVYYFAKNKGSMSKGAFETLLSQLATVEPGEQTIILADEIESVTEPGVAGRVVCATAEYFLARGCYLVIATHLGHEIQHRLPEGARIDGIEAKGLTETFELIVDHNPRIGKLAHSTPELIIERLAKTQQAEYFSHLYLSLNKKQLDAPRAEP